MRFPEPAEPATPSGLVTSENNRGHWLNLAMIIFLTWSVLFYCVRVWAKIRVKTMGSDDVVVTCALAVSGAFQGIMFVAVKKGYGMPTERLSGDSLDEVQQYIYFGQFCYVISVGLSRVAAALCIKHIAQHGPHTQPAGKMAWISGGWTFSSLCLIALRPPLATPWLALDGQNTMFVRWLIVEVAGLVVELASWALAIHLVWTLRMQRGRRFFIIAAFGVRLLQVLSLYCLPSMTWLMLSLFCRLFPLVALRLYFLAPWKNDDTNQSSIIAAIFMTSVLQFSIIATSVTALKPFLTVFKQPVVAYGRSTDSSGTNGKLEMFHRINRHKGLSDDSFNRRTDQSGSGRRSMTAEPSKAVTRMSRDGAGGENGRPYHISSSQPPRLMDPIADDGPFTMGDTSQLDIHKMTEVVVHYEDQQAKDNSYEDR